MLTSKLRWLSSTTAGAPGGAWRMVADECGLGWLAGLLIGAGKTTGDDEKAGSLALTAEGVETELANGLADGMAATVPSTAGPRAATAPQERTPMTAAATNTTLTALAATRANWRRWPPPSANSSSSIATSCGHTGKRRSRPVRLSDEGRHLRAANPQPKCAHTHESEPVSRPTARASLRLQMRLSARTVHGRGCAGLGDKIGYGFLG